MRWIPWVTALIAGAVGTSCAKQPVAETQPIVETQTVYPWCLRNVLNDPIDSCGFDSLEQCKQALGQSRGTCFENLKYRQQQQSTPSPPR
jgi:hypothetical protein